MRDDLDLVRASRRADRVFDELANRATNPAPAPAVMVGRVFNSAGRGVPGYFSVRPIALGGPEVEGGTPSLTEDSSSSQVFLVLGPGPPLDGDLLVAARVNGRWVARRGNPDGTHTHALPGCPCAAIPDHLYMHVQRQPSNRIESVVFPSDLVYGPKPGDLAAYRSDLVGWYSPTVFTASDFFYRFRYWFGCSQNLYFVAGLMTPDSPLGYPGLFAIMSWLVGLPGNTCSPFKLTAGATNSTTYQEQGISIDGNGPAAPPPPGAGFGGRDAPGAPAARVPPFFFRAP